MRRRRVQRHGVVRSDAQFVNATGVGAYDDLCLEHNGLLSTDPSVSLATLARMLPGNKRIGPDGGLA